MAPGAVRWAGHKDQRHGGNPVPFFVPAAVRALRLFATFLIATCAYPLSARAEFCS